MTAAAHVPARRVGAALLATTLALTAAACSGGDAADDTVEIEVATWGSPDHISITSFLPEFEDALAELSDGGITVEHVPSGALAEDGDMATAIPRGTVTMGLATSNLWSGAIKDTAIFDSPALTLSFEQLNDAMDDPEGLGGVLEAEYEDYGAVVLAWTQLGAGALISDEPIRVPSDLKGRVMRTYSEGGAKLVNAAGGSPASVAFAEVYTALQRGSVEGAHVGFQGIKSQRLFEVASQATVPAGFFGTSMPAWVVNKDWWDGLTDNQREIISEAAKRAETASRAAIAEDRAKLGAEYEDLGMTVFDLQPDDSEYPEWEEFVAPIADQAADEFSEKVIAAIDQAGG